jgi:hypothetical protein
MLCKQTLKVNFAKAAIREIEYITYFYNKKLLSKMDYKNYKTASERHLETCIRLKEVVKTDYLNKTLLPSDLKKQNEILSNIYYLSGYVIECILHYAIVEYVVKVDSDFRKKIIKKRKGVGNFEEISVRELEVEHNNCGVGYNKGKWVLYQPGHRFQRNMQFFHVGNKINGIDSIRALNGKTIPQINVRTLFSKWNVGVRYSNSDFANLNTPKDILDFLDFAEEIYNGIINLILPNYA